jgi:putative peptide zinc metalloprotease protein
MGESVFSTYWYRIAKLKPKLRDTTVVSRHHYRGAPWYVLRNGLSGRSHRFNGAAYALIGRLDGRRTVQQIWDDANGPSAQNPPTQDEVIHLLGRLHDGDLIQSDILPSTVELVRQFRQTPGSDWKKRISNPFSIRFPLWDPDRFLEKWSFVTAPLFTRGAFIIWLLIVACALVTAGLNWPELTNSLSGRLLSPGNLLLIWLIYPLVKILHELGHAFAIKKWGGEVHETGIILLALTPIPYVDASASASFADKHQRITVAAMGMAVELVLASAALFVWLNVQPGLIKAMAYNVMLIGGVSTVLFNGNPLLRYDGYYILADLIEIPNLAQRATRYLSYLLQRYLLRIETAESPVTAAGEKGWFVLYGPIAFCYRMAVLVGLVLLVSSRFFAIGVLIAFWGALSLLVRPAVRNLNQFIKSPGVRSKRPRLAAVGGVMLGAILLGVFVLPVPLWTTAQGVVWLPKQSMVRAGTDCEVVEVLAAEEQVVAEHAPLIKGRDPFLDARIEVYQAQLEELYAGYNAQPLHKRVQRKLLLEQIARVKGDLQQVEDKREKLVVRSPARGKLILIEASKLPGRFVQKGELLGYILAEHRPTVRAVVRQTDIGLVRKRLKGVQVRLAEHTAAPLDAELQRIVPAADPNLPSAALGTAGGGEIPVDPADPEGLRALETVFQLDIELPGQVKDPHIGGRVYIRMEHGTMTLARQWYRRLRQLFLRKFYV